MKRPLLRSLIPLALGLALAWGTAAAEASSAHPWGNGFWLDDTAGDFLRFYSETATESLNRRLQLFRLRFAPEHRLTLITGPYGSQDGQTFYRKTLAETLQRLDESPEARTTLQRMDRLVAQTLPRLANRIHNQLDSDSLRLDRPYSLTLGFGATESTIVQRGGRPWLVIPVDGLSPDAPVEFRVTTDLVRLLRADVRSRLGVEPSRTLGAVAFEEALVRYYAYEELGGYTARDGLDYSPAEWARALARQRDLIDQTISNWDRDDSDTLMRWGVGAPATAYRPPRPAVFVAWLAVEKLRRTLDWNTLLEWSPEEARERAIAALVHHR